MSITASGKLADSIVFGTWKGIAYCRSWVVPVNKMSEDQGDNRMIVGGIGRAAAAVNPLSLYHLDMIAASLIPNGQTKQSALVKQLKAMYMGTATLFEAVRTAFEAHSAKADFTSTAALCGLSDFNVTYKGTTNLFSKGMMLYLLAKYGIDQGFTGTPYSVALGTWAATQITLLKTKLDLPA
jgi:hypothetical protein